MDWKQYLTDESKLLINIINDNRQYLHLPELKKQTKTIFGKINDNVLLSKTVQQNNHNIPIYEKELICIEKDFPLFYYIFPIIFKEKLNEKYKNDKNVQLFASMINNPKIKNKKLVSEYYNETSIEFKLDTSSYISDFILSQEKDQYLNQNFYYIQAFVPLDIQELVEDVGSQQKIFTWENNSVLITYNRYYKKCNKVNIVRLKNTIDAIKYFMKNDKKIEFHIFPCKLKKKLPDKHKGIIGINNINTGYSWGDNIVLYRSEELNKLIIHEMIHNLECDLYINQNESLKHFLFNNIMIQSTEINPRESYTEFCANMIHCILLFNEINKLQNHILTNEVLFELINYERLFSMIQACKILNYYGFNKFEDIFNYNTCKKLNLDECEKRCEIVNGNCILKKDYPVIKQTSNLLSYFITRSILMYNIDTLMNMFERMEIQTKNPYFYFSKEWNKEFGDIIMGGYYNKQFFKEMNNIMEWLKKKNINKYFQNNLRMTLIEFT